VAPTTVAPTTTFPDPDVVPAVITPAYVDAVFAVLDHVYGNAVRLMVATTNLPVQATVDLRAVFADPEYATELKIFHLELEQGFAHVRRPPGDRRTTVVRVLSASETCIFVQTKTSFRAVITDPAPETGTEYYALEKKSSANDPDRLNSTAWEIYYDVAYTAVEPPPKDPCGG